VKLYAAIKWILGKIPPKLWPWNKDASAKHLVWTCHVLVVAFAVGFALWLLYAITIDPNTANAPALEAQTPKSSPGGPSTGTQPVPLPMWVRILKSLSPLLAPLVSYGVWRYLPEPNGSE